MSGTGWAGEGKGRVRPNPEGRGSRGLRVWLEELQEEDEEEEPRVDD